MLEELRDAWTAAEQRDHADAARYAAMDHDTCQLCGAHGEDKRSLTISCLYAVHEVVPEAIVLHQVPGRDGDGYYLLICKACRGALLGHLKDWADERRARQGHLMDHDGNDLYDEPGRDILMRINGAIVMMTRSEWEDWRAAHHD